MADLDEIHGNYVAEQISLRDKLEKLKNDDYIPTERNMRRQRRFKLLEEKLIPDLVEKRSQSSPSGICEMEMD